MDLPAIVRCQRRGQRRRQGKMHVLPMGNNSFYDLFSLSVLFPLVVNEKNIKNNKIAHSYKKTLIVCTNT